MQPKLPTVEKFSLKINKVPKLKKDKKPITIGNEFFFTLKDWPASEKPEEIEFPMSISCSNGIPHKDTEMYLLPYLLEATMLTDKGA